MKGIANACLLENGGGNGERVVLTGEDLCNLGPVALLQGLALIALLGIEYVKRNGHNCYRGLGVWPTEWQNAALAKHGDLYERYHDEVRTRMDAGAKLPGQRSAK